MGVGLNFTVSRFEGWGKGAKVNSLCNFSRYMIEELILMDIDPVKFVPT
jgi:hypothetical protein